MEYKECIVVIDGEKAKLLGRVNEFTAHNSIDIGYEKAISMAKEYCIPIVVFSITIEMSQLEDIMQCTKVLFAPTIVDVAGGQTIHTHAIIVEITDDKYRIECNRRISNIKNEYSNLAYEYKYIEDAAKICRIATRICKNNYGVTKQTNVLFDSDGNNVNYMLINNSYVTSAFGEGSEESVGGRTLDGAINYAMNIMKNGGRIGTLTLYKCSELKSRLI